MKNDCIMLYSKWNDYFSFEKKIIVGGFWVDVSTLIKSYESYVVPSMECLISGWRIHHHISAKWWKFTCGGPSFLVYQPFTCKVIVPITWIFASLPLMHLSRKCGYVYTIYLSLFPKGPIYVKYHFFFHFLVALFT